MLRKVWERRATLPSFQKQTPGEILVAFPLPLEVNVFLRFVNRQREL